MTTTYLLISQVDHRLVQWAKGFTYCWNIITLACISKKAQTCIYKVETCACKAWTCISWSRFVSTRLRQASAKLDVCLGGGDSVSGRLRHASAGTDLDLQMCTFPGSHTQIQKTGATVCAYTARTLWEHQAWWSNLPYLWVAVSVKDQEIVGWVALLFSLHSALW